MKDIAQQLRSILVKSEDFYYGIRSLDPARFSFPFSNCPCKTVSIEL